MPYQVSLPLKKPYIQGVKVLDDQSGIRNLNIRHGDDLIRYGMNHGIPLNPKIVPRRFEIEISVKQMPDLISLALSWGVTDVFRDKVEELEAGVHQFFPVEIWARGGEQPTRNYWLMNVCNRVDAINAKESVLRSTHDGRFFDRHGLGENEVAKLVFHKSIIAGMSMWVDRRYPDTIFFCDELFAFVMDNEMAKLKFWKVYME